MSINRYITTGLLASVAASVCCIGPFALLATGISGAWMSRLMILEPIQPFLIVLTTSLFAIAGWKLFYSSTEHEQGNSCAAKKIGWQQKLAFFSTVSLAFVLLTSEYWILLLAE